MILMPTKRSIPFSLKLIAGDAYRFRDAEIGRDPRTAKPICITYNLLKGEKENVLKTEQNDNYEEATHPVYRTAVHS